MKKISRLMLAVTALVLGVMAARADCSVLSFVQVYPPADIFQTMRNFERGVLTTTLPQPSIMYSI